MKKWLFPALLTALLLAAVGCDKTDAPISDLPETVDGLTVVTTGKETETPTEPNPETEPEAEPVTEPVTEPVETDPPAPETEVLSAEEVAELLDEIVLRMADRENGPIEVNMTAEARLTAHMYGFSGTTTIPLSSYYAVDGEGEVMLAYAVPMKGTGVYVVANGMLYLRNGTDTALKAPLDESSVDDVKDILLKRLMGRLGEGIPNMTLPEPKGGFMESGLTALPSVEFDLAGILGQAISSVPLEKAFVHVTAVRDTASGTVSLVLSGISDEVLDAMNGILSALPEDTLPDSGEESGLDAETAAAVITLLREQAETAVTVTLTVDGDHTVTEVATVTSLDLTEIPELTANMPVEMEIITAFTINRENISVEAPQDAALYTEVALKDLLPPEEVPEEENEAESRDGAEEETAPATEETETDDDREASA